MAQVPFFPLFLSIIAPSLTPNLASTCQGVTGSVVDKGSITRFVPYLVQGVCHGFQDIGVKSIDEAWEGSRTGTVRVEIRSPAAQVSPYLLHLPPYFLTLCIANAVTACSEKAASTAYTPMRSA